MGDGADLSEEPPPAPLPPAPRRAGKRPKAQEQHSGRAWEAGPVHHGRETDHAEGAAASGPPGSSQPGAVPQEVPRGPSRRPPPACFPEEPLPGVGATDGGHSAPPRHGHRNWPSGRAAQGVPGTPRARGRAAGAAEAGGASGAEGRLS